jgi:hypothetical protein
MKPKLRLIRNPIEDELLLATKWPWTVEKLEPECRIIEEEWKPDLKLVKS